MVALAKEKGSQASKLESEVREIKGKRDSMKKELEEHIKTSQIRHEREIEKLRSEISRG